MGCSINIIRKIKPVREVKYVPTPELYEDEFEVNVESALLDLYEKVGILKQRIDKLEGR